ncbi:MAG: DNA polymerase III subunit beta [Chromatiaceae bacterium]|nr:MAG: DNA polymerase III subunit beta [Chromatiaceae bacterium]
MKIALERSQLLSALSLVAGVVERRQTLPILGNVLIVAEGEGISLKATDLELEIGTAAQAKIEKPGAVTVPARKLLDICRNLPDGAQINLRTEGERATIVSDRSRFSLSTLSADDFPVMEMGAVELTLDIEQVVLRRLLDKTAFAMAQQDVRYYLNGVLLELQPERLTAVATDGHRLAKVTAGVDAAVTADLEQPLQVIVPGKTVQELRRVLGTEGNMVRLEFSQRTMRLLAGNAVLTSKLVDGRYPEYERVIPKNLERQATVNKELLRAALQRTAILSNEKYKGVRVSFSDSTLALQSNNPEKEEAEDAIEISYQGIETTIGFNVSYVLDVLNVISDDAVEVFFRDGDSSAVWQGEGASDETFVIMPMRL